ncbi:hypothetical protein ACFQBQ_00745 [Granulicella cerasi]|uniref:Uncharacterized protein n=1 Tax=Granulicella cerasi TaxID=741063 RepID=A0ABW1Z3L0_9BACT|nr:hypothetical protein [Granulicella cerasi]
MATSSSTFILGFGSTLSIATSSTGTATPVNQLSKITYTAEKADYIDVTTLSSPSAAAGGPVVKESAPGTITPGTASVTGILDPAGDPGQVMVSASFDTQTLLYFTHQFAPASSQTTGAKRTFTGYISEKPTMDASLTDAVNFNFSIQVTGVIAYTPGS